MVTACEGSAEYATPKGTRKADARSLPPHLLRMYMSFTQKSCSCLPKKIKCMPKDSPKFIESYPYYCSTIINPFMVDHLPLCWFNSVWQSLYSSQLHLTILPAGASKSKWFHCLFSFHSHVTIADYGVILSLLNAEMFLLSQENIVLWFAFQELL